MKPNIWNTTLKNTALLTTAVSTAIVQEAKNPTFTSLHIVHIWHLPKLAKLYGPRWYRESNNQH